MDTRPRSASALFERTGALLPELRGEAARLDQEAAFPSKSLQKLGAAGLLTATLPPDLGGFGLCGAAGARDLFRLLHLLGEANLALGRIFEAHVNAIELVRRYGTSAQMQAVAEAARGGDLFALWVTDPPGNALRLDEAHIPRALVVDPLARQDQGAPPPEPPPQTQLTDSKGSAFGGVPRGGAPWPSPTNGSMLKAPGITLQGEKWFCSAAGAARLALVTVETASGTRMLLVNARAAKVTDQGVRLAGMRAATTGSVDLSSIAVTAEALIGQPGDYLREPVFSTGAWRSAAVALGGLAALIEAARAELRARGRDGQPYQRMRFGQAAIAHETGRLWMLEAAARAEAAAAPGEEAVAYVNLARTAVEAACLDAIRLIQRSLGLSAFMQGSAAERIARDLATYLRQPAPDEALAEAAGYFFEHGLIAR